MTHPVFNKSNVAKALGIKADDIIRIQYHKNSNNVNVVAKKRGSRFYKFSKFFIQFGQDRHQRAQIEKISVKKVHSHRYLVSNQTKQTEYVVTLESNGFFHCTCDDVFNQVEHGVFPVFCKHIAATLYTLGFRTYNDFLQKSQGHDL